MNLYKILKLDIDAGAKNNFTLFTWFYCIKSLLFGHSTYLSFPISYFMFSAVYAKTNY